MSDWTERLAENLIRALADTYPTPERANTRKREWLANMDNLNSSGAKLRYALTCTWPALKAQPNYLMLVLQLFLGTFLLAARVFILWLLPQMLITMGQTMVAGHWTDVSIQLFLLAFLLLGLPHHDADFDWVPRWTYPDRVMTIIAIMSLVGMVSGLLFGPLTVRVGFGLFIAAGIFSTWTRRNSSRSS